MRHGKYLFNSIFLRKIPLITEDKTKIEGIQPLSSDSRDDNPLILSGSDYMSKTQFQSVYNWVRDCLTPKRRRELEDKIINDHFKLDSEEISPGDGTNICNDLEDKLDKSMESQETSKAKTNHFK
jgi:hypothetical protein